MENVQTTPAVIRRRRERWFYVAMSIAIVITVFAGFAPTFYLRPRFTSAGRHAGIFHTGWCGLLFSPSPRCAQTPDDARHHFNFGGRSRALTFSIMQAGPPAFFGLTDIFILACVLYDLITLRRIHRATALAGLLIVASQPLRLLIGGTHAWLVFATWLTHFVR